MRKIEVTVNAQPDWKTQYPPELVGKYLLEHEKAMETGPLQETPGAVFLAPPEPSLDGFLKWSVTNGLE